MNNKIYMLSLFTTMKYTILPLSLLFILCFLSCSGNKHSYISGTLPNKEYDGEWIYLVSLENEKNQKTDSFMIKDGEFNFKTSQENISVLRMRFALRDILQELLIVTEPGIIDVKIDSISSSSGTPQNNFLQNWKNKKEEYDATNNKYRIAQRNDSASVKINNLLQKKDSLSTDLYNFTTDYIKDNPSKSISLFLYKITRHTLPEKQKNILDDLYNKE